MLNFLFVSPNTVYFLFTFLFMAFKIEFLDGRRKSSDPYIQHLAGLDLNISTVHLEHDGEMGTRVFIPLSKTREFLDTSQLYLWVSCLKFCVMTINVT